MAGLFIKEMKMRAAVEKILIIVPAALRIQWQDELLRFFNEYFIIVDAELDRQQVVNIWQKENQVITSIDYAKQEEVRERVWQQDFDIVIVDEAHKCSAYTKRRSNRSPEVEKTKRYQLVEKLALRPNHFLFLTATPHYGDDDRFCHFLRLIDPDVFPEPHKYQSETKDIKRLIFPDKDNPWILRRLKEDLCDLNGRPLFTKRHAKTVPFKLSVDEDELYEAVTNYLNRFLAIQGTGRIRQSIALTRTVFQRRLASSTYAIYETLKRRLQKQKEFLEELENLSPRERVKLLERRRGVAIDEEMDEGDMDEQDRDRLINEFSGAREIKELSAVRESKDGKCFLTPPDIIHDLASCPEKIENLPEFDIEKVKDYLMANYQFEKRQEMLKERQHKAKIVKEYLEKSFNARIFATENKIMEVKAKEGDSGQVDIARLEKEAEIPRVSTFVESEEAAMKIVMEYERDRGWEPEDVSMKKLGFDIRSLSPADPKTGYREVRRIEVKGRRKAQNVRLTLNEWLKGKQLKDTYWLYVVCNPTEDNYEIITIPDPANKLEYAAKEIRAISHYEIDGKEIERFGGKYDQK